MSTYTAATDDLNFLLNWVFKLEQHCALLEGVEALDADTSRQILNEAAKTCEQILAPIDAAGDSEGCHFVNTEVRAPKGYKEAYRAWCEAGWGGLSGAERYGGMAMPKLFSAAIEEMLQGSNMAFGLAPMLTAGACLALDCHASEELKALYLPRMYSGQWSGAMDLTEAHAGSDLGLMRAKAVAQDDGNYALSGSKIFITWGEHDMAENIVHLVLARLPDAPPGSRGISLFLVPKFIVNSDGSLAKRNQLSCGSIEHKMGIHASPTCVMNFDAAQGMLIGEPHQGLACMFTMMNYERLVVGIQALGVAEKSYQTARNYALERRQGKAIDPAQRDTEHDADCLIVHADVRRMLLSMKAMNEAGRAFYLYVAKHLDLWRYAKDSAVQAEAEARVALLTPVVKAFISDRAFDTCVQGQQVLGGHGYCAEWGQEQRVRDVRITQIYEGTNGIQAMDLVLRKLLADQGLMLAAYIEEMRVVARRNQGQALCVNFNQAIDLLERVSKGLVASADKQRAAAVGVDYLDLLGYVSYAYMWILMLEALDGSAGVSATEKAKPATASYFFAQQLAQIESLALKIERGGVSLMAMPAELF